jgi:hypothetical protein
MADRRPAPQPVAPCVDGKLGSQRETRWCASGYGRARHACHGRSRRCRCRDRLPLRRSLEKAATLTHLAPRPHHVGLPADAAATVIAKAVTARKPRTRYTVGRDAALLTRLARILSARTLDRVVAAALRPHFPKEQMSTSTPRLPQLCVSQQPREGGVLAHEVLEPGEIQRNRIWRVTRKHVGQQPLSMVAVRAATAVRPGPGVAGADGPNRRRSGFISMKH